jgi:hypothetical protein
MTTTTFYPPAITGGDAHVTISVELARGLFVDFNRQFSTEADARAWAEKWHAQRGMEMKET